VTRRVLITPDYTIKLINLLQDPENFDEVRKDREIQIALMESV
jgi:hypothetical protein